jgi:hypothetical protein
MNFDQEIHLTITAGDCNVLFQLLNDAPFRVAAPLIEKMRGQILAADSSAFNPPSPQPQSFNPPPPNGAIQGGF